MGVLDQVIELKNRGFQDQDIIRNLREQGISPADITDAFSRAQIKNAVSNLDNANEATYGMEPSILGSEEEPERLPVEGLEGGSISDEDLTPPRPGGFYPTPMRITKEISNASEETYIPQETYPVAQYAQSQRYPSQQDYQYSQYSQQAGGITDTDTMIEVADQVFSEKNKPLQKKIEDMNEFRVLAQANIDHISERLKKIESIIDKLQATILEKVGDYGGGIESVKKELTMMQDSFGKMVNGIADRQEEKHQHHHIQHHAQHNTQNQEQYFSQPKSSSQHHITVHKSKKTTRKNSKR
jgi:hypothetical protein